MHPPEIWRTESNPFHFTIPPYQTTLSSFLIVIFLRSVRKCQNRARITLHNTTNFTLYFHKSRQDTKQIPVIRIWSHFTCSISKYIHIYMDALKCIFLWHLCGLTGKVPPKQTIVFFQVLFEHGILIKWNLVDSIHSNIKSQTISEKATNQEAMKLFLEINI
jgi:hypothetical protein